MARKAGRGAADCERTLKTLRSNCPACGKRMWADYDKRGYPLSSSTPYILRGLPPTMAL